MELNLKHLIALISLISNAFAVKTCPKYTCSQPSNVTACAAVEVGTNENKVYLNDICSKDQMCVVPLRPWEIFAELNMNAAYSCDKPSYPLTFVRYPGEDCTVDEDCYKSKFDEITGKCMNGKCMGYNTTQSCTEHAECWVGLYCGRMSQTDPHGTCTEQKKQDSDCGTSYECTNDYLCLSGKCSTKPYSLPLGTQVNADSVFPASVYCQFGYAFKGECSSLNQTDVTNKDLDYLKQCNHGEACHYTNNGKGNVTLYCDCGYNENGYGYCPRGHDTSKLIFNH
jgi:hypothetical protein